MKKKFCIQTWQKAQKIIPGGTMLFSKKPDLYLPDNWPSYFKKAKDSTLIDLDNNQYTDMMFLVGTNSMGYTNKNIDNAVIDTIKNSNMSSLNAPEEVYLAEKLIKLHPWAEMVRFARSGGEANAISIRIARAATDKQNIAFCGYHGWHDWYLSANLKNKDNLNKHLMNDLPILGVDRKLKNSSFPFEYNNFKKLLELVEKKNIGIIKMEVSRNIEPNNNFLKKVRLLCNKKNIILIFDECTSGFRQTYGGLHKYYGVNPDIAMFGKALGNGYAINAIIGKRNIMEYAQKTFISSTFWTERIGSVAGLATLQEMKRQQSWKKITKLGKKIKLNWLKISKNYDYDIEIGGLDAIPNFIFKNVNNLIHKTYFTQEMLKKKYLASNLIFVSTVHDKVINGYFSAMDEVFHKMSHYDDKSLLKMIDGRISENSFKKIN